MSVANKLLQAAAGGGSDPVYVDDVFSTFLYGGNGSTQNIVNGLDLSGEGGMVWIKGRTTADYPAIYDTARGQSKVHYSALNSAEASNSDLSAFNNNGFSLQHTNGQTNYSGQDYVSWAFRKQEKFFDIVTYTGNGANRTIAHNLGSVPGMIIVKRTDTTGDWQVYHRGNTGSPETDYLVLNSTAVTADSNTRWNDTAPTNAVFSVGTEATVNASSGTYVAYLFAHDEQNFGENSDEAIIKCGSYSGNSAGSATTDQTITLGFEPQWILIRKYSGGIGSWSIFDNMRGVMADGADRELRGNASTVEQTTDENLRFEADGFTLEGSNLNYTDGSTAHEYIYMAIARPHKPASEFAATDVFKPQVLSAGEGSDTFISTGFPVDAVIYTKRTSNATNVLGTRLTGGTKTGGDLKTDGSDAEGTNSGAFFLDHNDGVTVDFSGGHFNVAPAATDTDYARYYFRRMREFFDIVTYTGNGSNRTITHNLGVAPELMIIKSRSNGFNWQVYISASGSSKRFLLNSTSAELAHNDCWNTTDPTDSVFSLGTQSDVNHSGATFIALLFASASGISKVGSYSGTGSSQNIDCGFSNGARFVLIKNKNNAGGWYFWDSERGITAGNDPFLRLGANDGDQNYTGDDIDPHSSGFNVSSNNNAVNKSGRDYIFLAIA
jgi:hypothetical protein